jgi:hypothetical protein
MDSVAVSAATAAQKIEIRTRLRSSKNKSLRRLALRLMVTTPVSSWRMLMMNKIWLMEPINKNKKLYQTVVLRILK